MLIGFLRTWLMKYKVCAHNYHLSYLTIIHIMLFIFLQILVDSRLSLRFEPVNSLKELTFEPRITRINFHCLCVLCILYRILLFVYQSLSISFHVSQVVNLDQAANVCHIVNANFIKQIAIFRISPPNFGVL